MRAFAWFLGNNDLSAPLVDLETGGCRDGLHRDRANENRGGESTVSYLFSLAEIRQLARISGDRSNCALPGVRAHISEAHSINNRHDASRTAETEVFCQKPRS